MKKFFDAPPSLNHMTAISSDSVSLLVPHVSHPTPRNTHIISYALQRPATHPERRQITDQSGKYDIVFLLDTSSSMGTRLHASSSTSSTHGTPVVTNPNWTTVQVGNALTGASSSNNTPATLAPAPSSSSNSRPTPSPGPSTSHGASTASTGLRTTGSHTILSTCPSEPQDEGNRTSRIAYAKSFLFRFIENLKGVSSVSKVTVARFASDFEYTELDTSSTQYSIDQAIMLRAIDDYQSRGGTSPYGALTELASKFSEQRPTLFFVISDGEFQLPKTKKSIPETIKEILQPHKKLSIFHIHIGDFASNSNQFICNYFNVPGIEGQHAFHAIKSAETIEPLVLKIISQYFNTPQDIPSLVIQLHDSSDNTVGEARIPHLGIVPYGTTIMNVASFTDTDWSSAYTVKFTLSTGSKSQAFYMLLSEFQSQFKDIRKEVMLGLVAFSQKFYQAIISCPIVDFISRAEDLIADFEVYVNQCNANVLQIPQDICKDINMLYEYAKELCKSIRNREPSNPSHKHAKTKLELNNQSHTALAICQKYAEGRVDPSSPEWQEFSGGNKQVSRGGFFSQTPASSSSTTVLTEKIQEALETYIWIFGFKQAGVRAGKKLKDLLKCEDFITLEHFWAKIESSNDKSLKEDCAFINYELPTCWHSIVTRIRFEMLLQDKAETVKAISASFKESLGQDVFTLIETLNIGCCLFKKSLDNGENLTLMKLISLYANANSTRQKVMYDRLQQMQTIPIDSASLEPTTLSLTSRIEAVIKDHIEMYRNSLESALLLFNTAQRTLFVKNPDINDPDCLWRAIHSVEDFTKALTALVIRNPVIDDPDSLWIAIGSIEDYHMRHFMAELNKSIPMFWPTFATCIGFEILLQNEYIGRLLSTSKESGIDLATLVSKPSAYRNNLGLDSESSSVIIELFSLYFRAKSNKTIQADMEMQLKAVEMDTISDEFKKSPEESARLAL